MRDRTRFRARCALRRLLAAWAVVALAGCGADQPIRAQEGTVAASPSLLSRWGPEEGVHWFRIADAAFHGRRLAVLSSGDSAVHLIGPDGIEAWGRPGSGPGEFRAAETVAWLGDDLVIRDYELQRIGVYSADGSLLRTLPNPSGVVPAMVGIGDRVLMESQDIFSRRTVILAVGSSAVDTLLSWSVASHDIQISADGAPSLTLGAPFAPVPRWSAASPARLFFWSEADPTHVVVRDLATSKEARWSLPDEPIAVQEADREAWFLEHIPSETIMGRPDAMAPLRDEARRSLQFPSSFPSVLELMADPVEGVWVRRSGVATGAVWRHVAGDGLRARIRLPPHGRLLAMAVDRYAILTTDALDRERIEIHRRPRPSTIEDR